MRLPVELNDKQIAALRQTRDLLAELADGEIEGVPSETAERARAFLRGFPPLGNEPLFELSDEQMDKLTAYTIACHEADLAQARAAEAEREARQARAAVIAAERALLSTNPSSD